METRFPISADKGHVNKLSFPWYDAFRPAKRTSQANVHLEKAAVMFNVGAALSQQALQVERGTAEGIKQACQLFQEAAGVFGALRDGEAAKVDAPRPVDLSPECCAMLEKLMLAQAQVLFVCLFFCVCLYVCVLVFVGVVAMMTVIRPSQHDPTPPKNKQN